MLLFISVLTICIISRSEADFFIPCLPHLQEYFGLSVFATELSVSFNFAGYCLGGLLAGILGDKFTHRTIILYNLVGFALGTLICAVAPYYEILLIGRLLQGFSIAGATVLGYVVLITGNKFNEQLKNLGLINGILTLLMAIVPTIGGHLGMYGHWRFNFLAVFVLSLIALLLSYRGINISSYRDPASVGFKSYIPLLKSKKVLLFTATLCFMITPYWVFINMSPIYYVNDLKMPLIDYIYHKNVLSIVFGVVSILNGFFVKIWGCRRCLFISISLCITSGLLQLMIVVTSVNNPYIVTLSMAILAAGAAFLINFLYANALNAFSSDVVGKVSALIHSMRLIFTSISLSIVSKLYSGDFSVIGIALIGMLFFGLLLTTVLHSYKQFKEG